MYPANENETILKRALAALQETTGIAGNVALEPVLAPEGRRADAQVEICANGKTYPYVVEIKRVDRFAYIGQIKYLQEHYANPLLLVAPHITTEIAEKCREMDLQFIDAAGNAYLRAPDLFVLVKGQRLTEEVMNEVVKDGKRVGTATHLRVIFALLWKPDLLNAPYRKINQTAGVALGAVGWVFHDMKMRGYTAGGGKRKRLLLERQKLEQEWVTNYPIKLRPKLNARKFRAQTTDWWKRLDVTKYGAQWGGEVAAEKLTGYLRPNTYTLYLHAKNAQRNLNRLVMDNKLRADPQGDIEILDAFWDFAEDQPMPETVPRILVYADLLATLDPRNLETARLIHDQNNNDTQA